jgi:demethylmenaquinone methyltransferase/2-methoxy-6-polyprenyl-1,4-benzoquinol methylase
MTRGPNPGGATASFGFRVVSEDEKASLVRSVFDSVAPRYDLMNDLMSGGVHRLWKAAFLDEIAPRPGESLLDVAGGTGDIARRFLAAAGGPATGARVVLCDITAAMVAIGRDRSLDAGILQGIDHVVGDAERLPVASRAFDVCAVAFGLRNVTHIDAALAEAYRVLRPGGRFFVLEFSRVVLPLLDKLYDLYSFAILPALGDLVTGDRAAYQYLVESIRRFPPQADLARLIGDAGFGCVRWRNLSGGIAAIHVAWRL